MANDVENEFNSLSPGSVQATASVPGAGSVTASASANWTTLTADSDHNGTDRGSARAQSVIYGYGLEDLQQLNALISANVNLMSGTTGSLYVSGFIASRDCQGPSSENGDCLFSGSIDFCKPNDEGFKCEGYNTEGEGVLSGYIPGQTLQLALTRGETLPGRGEVQLAVGTRYPGEKSGHVKVTLSTDSFQPFKSTSGFAAKGNEALCALAD